MILFTLATVNRVLPNIVANIMAFITGIMPAVIVVAVILGLIGVKFSLDFMKPILNLFNFFCRTTVAAIGWGLRSLFGMIPRIYRELNRNFVALGLSTAGASTLAAVVTVVFIVIII